MFTLAFQHVVTLVTGEQVWRNSSGKGYGSEESVGASGGIVAWLRVVECKCQLHILMARQCMVD